MLLTACATAAPPSPAPDPVPLPYPASARERVLRIARAEWQEWGAAIVAPDAPPPLRGAEADPAHYPRLLAYWRAVPDPTGLVRTREAYAAALAGRAEGGALGREPFWSAAFVSYVFAAAGLDAVDLPPAPAHATYVDALIARAARHPAGAAFVPRALSEHAPRPGDVLCADRSDRPLADWRERAADAGRFRPMHCDIVVGVGPGVVEAIGGNVADRVALTRWPADAFGRLLPAPPGRPPPFVVFESRLGCLPPWAHPGDPCSSSAPALVEGPAA